MLNSIEQTKIMDHIFIKYNGVRFPSLMQAVKHHDLEDDDDVVALKNANKAQRE